MAVADGEIPLDVARCEEAADAMAATGFRVLAFAAGPVAAPQVPRFGLDTLANLTLLGLVGLIDPVRPEAPAAIAACREAGIAVAMVTGDHPTTALAIARELGLAERADQVTTGTDIRQAAAAGEAALDAWIAGRRVFARVEPQQKLDVVRSLQRQRHFVAVTGDGANDVPALRAAHVGVAMGQAGTDMARESADLILTDDNFASIVGGIEAGRIAYANVRKVIFLLISTGAAELVLFFLSLGFTAPLPLLPLQVLWLNLMTNGIQDKALAFEPGEGDELRRAPRLPSERVFDRLMVRRVVLSGLYMGSVAFTVFQAQLAAGTALADARNVTLLLMVLFENGQVFNSRSECLSIFRHPLKGSGLLLAAVGLAQGVHVAALYSPLMQQVLGLQPIPLRLWGELLLVACTLVLVMELEKGWRWRHGDGHRRGDGTGAVDMPGTGR
jgi:magnesium-transporting ATPase (P-type)